MSDKQPTKHFFKLRLLQKKSAHIFSEKPSLQKAITLFTFYNIMDNSLLIKAAVAVAVLLLVTGNSLITRRNVTYNLIFSIYKLLASLYSQRSKIKTQFYY